MGKKRKRSNEQSNSVAQGIFDIQVLGTNANGLAPSILVRTIRGNYLFNAGDGLQRFCIEHKVKMSKINGIFLTDLSSQTTGGLPGALLTMSDLSGDAVVSKDTTNLENDNGLKQTHIYGPQGTGKFLYAMRHFFYRPEFALYATEFNTESGAANLEHGGLSSVLPVVLLPKVSSSSTSSTSSASSPLSSSTAASSSSFVSSETDNASGWTCKCNWKNRKGNSVCGGGSQSHGCGSSYVHQFAEPSSCNNNGDSSIASISTTTCSSSSISSIATSNTSSSTSSSTSSITTLPSPQWNYVNHRMNLRVADERARMTSPSIHVPYFQPPRPVPNAVVCYVCQTPDIRGKFDAARATALGVKGRQRGELVRGGGPITLEDGRVVKREDVMADDIPGVVFSIVRCPTMEHASELSSNLNKISFSNGVATKLFYHIVPTLVLTSEFYQTSVIDQCPKEALHILVNADICPRIDAMLSGQRNVILLNQIHSGIFPFQEDIATNGNKDGGDSKSTIKNNEEIPVDKETLFAHQDNDTNDDANISTISTTAPSFVFAPSNRCVPAQTKSVVRLVPVVSTVLQQDLTEVPKLQLSQDIIQEAKDQELLSNVQIEKLHDAEKEFHSSTSLLSSEITDADPAITFLGTGSAIPAKLRNVTSILLQMKSGAVLLDAGEGTYYQMLRHFHGNQQKLDQLLSEIQLIWISHKHADHHLGLSLLLVKRALLSKSIHGSLAPIVIVCPSPVIGWLTEIAAIDPCLRDTFICVACVSTATVHPPKQFYGKKQSSSSSSSSSSDSSGGGGGGGGSGNKKARRRGTQVTLSSLSSPLRKVLETLNLESLESVSVNHCHLSYGIVLTSNAGWKLVFSGDTTPDQRLWQRGQNADLLIHEATFDSEMVEDAKNKKHSTVAGAIDVGKRMNAKHIILTHFSQRYPRLPTFGVEDAMNNVTVSFDFMTVRMSQLTWLPKMLPALQCLYPSADCDL